MQARLPPPLAKRLSVAYQPLNSVLADLLQASAGRQLRSAAWLKVNLNLKGNAAGSTLHFAHDCCG